MIGVRSVPFQMAVRRTYPIICIVPPLDSRLMHPINQMPTRFISRGAMYTPKELYRIRGPSKNNRHINPKFRSLRANKVIKMNLPNLDSYLMDKLKQEDNGQFVREMMRTTGLEPSRATEKQTKFFLACSNTIMDPYKPAENDGSFSTLASSDVGVTGALKAKGKSLSTSVISKATRRWATALEKIRKADPGFDVKTFGGTALEIYVRAHDALQNRDELAAHDLVTEHLFVRFWSELELKTLRWQYIESLEPPTVVNLRQGGVDQETLFGQVTVRFHSRQKLAIYDQFGRLFYGDENVARDVLEYVVFENFLSNEYGVWRMHDKILSKKSHETPNLYRTYKQPAEDKKEQLSYKYSIDIDEKSIDGPEQTGGGGEQPKTLKIA